MIIKNLRRYIPGRSLPDTFTCHYSQFLPIFSFKETKIIKKLTYFDYKERPIFLYSNDKNKFSIKKFPISNSIIQSTASHRETH